MDEPLLPMPGTQPTPDDGGDDDDVLYDVVLEDSAIDRLDRLGYSGTEKEQEDYFLEDLTVNELNGGDVTRENLYKLMVKAWFVPRSSCIHQMIFENYIQTGEYEPIYMDKEYAVYDSETIEICLDSILSLRVTERSTTDGENET